MCGELQWRNRGACGKKTKCFFKDFSSCEIIPVFLSPYLANQLAGGSSN